MRQASPIWEADLPTPRATPLHRYYHSPVGLPSCVTPSLAYYHSGSHAPPPSSRRTWWFRVVSIGGVSLGVRFLGGEDHTRLHGTRPAGPPSVPTPTEWGGH